MKWYWWVLGFVVLVLLFVVIYFNKIKEYFKLGSELDEEGFVVLSMYKDTGFPLKKFSKSDNVLKLQKVLNLYHIKPYNDSGKGVYFYPIVEDGMFGDATEKAVEKFLKTKEVSESVFNSKIKILNT